MAKPLSSTVLWMGLTEAFEVFAQQQEQMAGFDMGTVASDQIAAYQASMAEPHDEDNSYVPYGVTLVGDTAHVRMIGALHAYENFMTWLMGWPTYQRLRLQLGWALRTESVKRVFLEADTPGGTTSMLHEVRALVDRIREHKEIVVHVTGNLASAGYFIGSGATAITTNRMGRVGSIGTVWMRMDSSKYAEKEGLALHVVSTGKHKGLGMHPMQEFTELERETMQAAADDLTAEFVSVVAAGRDKSEAYVRTAMASGLMYMPNEALELGMIDGIMSMDESFGATIAGKFDRQQPDATQTPILGASQTTKQGTTMTEAELQALNAAAGISQEATAEEDNATQTASTEAQATNGEQPAGGEQPTGEQPTGEQPAQTEGNDSVVGTLRAMLSEKDTALMQARLESENRQTQLTASQAAVTAMSQVLASQVNAWSVKLGGSTRDLSAMDPMALVQEHASMQARVMESFKPGGVARVTQSDNSVEKEVLPSALPQNRAALASFGQH